VPEVSLRRRRDLLVAARSSPLRRRERSVKLAMNGVMADRGARGNRGDRFRDYAQLVQSA
jgi:hypothetical protein